MSIDQRMTHEDWMKRGRELFGPEPRGWRFVCPTCGHVTKAAEWIDAGKTAQVAFSCIGRLRTIARDAFDSGPGPCNYAGGGLFQLNPIELTMTDGATIRVFRFDEPKMEA